MFQGKPIELETRLTISRPNCSNGREYISIQLNDVLSGCRISTTEIDLADFTRALTGLGHVPCTAEIFLHAPIGKTRETKVERVPRRERSSDKHTQERVEDAFRAIYETDGWRARVSDLWNSHRWCILEDGSTGVTVTFERWVDTEVQS